ncbi:MAG: glucose-6-phosphate dehydrogenase [Candidatus Brocadiia bacterium]
MLLKEVLTARQIPSCSFVIFGASGDLTARKLIPALHVLFCLGFLPSPFKIVGTSRKPSSTDEFRVYARDSVAKFSRMASAPSEQTDAFLDLISFACANPVTSDGFDELAEHLSSEGMPANRLFYLATPPPEFEPIAAALGAKGLVHESGNSTPWARIIVEKPFGRDLASARELNRNLQSFFTEDQIYRIDHYLGKETVQNFLVFRFANAIFEPLWNNRYVDHVQISVCENIGVGSRGQYYDHAGALRDMVQNHILQVLSLIAMEPPSTFGASSVRGEKIKVLNALRPIAPDEVTKSVIRGQYGTGFFLGEHCKGYREENGVAKDSVTETYVALKLLIDNWRWAGVPFYIRTGKRMPKRVSEVSVHFKPVPHFLFRDVAEQMKDNLLALRIQPEEGISLLVECKVPGLKIRLQPVKMDFDYGGAFGAPSPDAYERLLLDAISGDMTLFTHEDEAYRTWTFLEGIMAGWAKLPPPMYPNYAAGSWGPDEAEQMLAQDARTWRRP